MIRTLQIKRAQTTALGDSLQISANSQIAVSSISKITVLDPIVPSDSAVSPFKGIPILDPLKLYSHPIYITLQSPAETYLRKLALFNTTSEITRITPNADPLITSMSWSPPINSNSFLGVLFSTNELLVFVKSSIDQYSVKFSFLDQLLLDNGISGESSRIIDKQLLQKLTVSSFSFSQLFDDGEKECPIFISVAVDDGISIYQISNILTKKISFSLGHFIRQSWSPWVKKGSKLTSYLVLISPDNTTYLKKFTYEKGLIESTHDILLPSSRFHLSKTNWFQNDDSIVLSIVSTTELHIFEVTAKETKTSSIELPTHHLVVDIIHTADQISLSTKFEIYTFTYKNSGEHIVLTQTVSKLQEFLIKKLKQFKIHTDQDGKVSIFGMKLNYFGNVVILGYDIYLANSHWYETESVSKFNLGFVLVRDLSEAPKADVVSNITSLVNSSWMNQHCFNNFANSKFKIDMIKPVSDLKVVKTGDFHTLLFTNLAKNKDLFNLQLDFENEESIKKIQKFIGKIITSQDKITNPIDIYIFESYRKILSPETPPSQISTISLSNTFTIEEFSTSSIMPNQAVSTANHTWSVCSLTLLPLLNVGNKKCINCKRYVVRMEVLGEVGWLCEELLGLEFCVYCGCNVY